MYYERYAFIKQEIIMAIGIGPIGKFPAWTHLNIGGQEPNVWVFMQLTSPVVFVKNENYSIADVMSGCLYLAPDRVHRYELTIN